MLKRIYRKFARAKEVEAPVERNATISATVIRADGTKEELGVIAKGTVKAMPGVASGPGQSEG